MPRLRLLIQHLRFHEIIQRRALVDEGRTEDSTGLAREERVAPAEVDLGCDEGEEQEDAEREAERCQERLEGFGGVVAGVGSGDEGQRRKWMQRKSCR